MKAQKMDKGRQVYGKRSILADQLPLNTPFVVQISPAERCNFKCNYCIYSNDSIKEKYQQKEPLLTRERHEKIINNLSIFPSKIKKLIYVGIGEPLINKHLPEMIKYAYDSGVAENIDILTNGSLLTHDTSDRLISSGLSALRVSLQGINAEDYKKIAGVNIDFSSFIENLKYFSSKKHKTTILYMKIANSALSVAEDEFFSFYGDIADTLCIETTLPLFPDVDYSKVIKESHPNKTMRGDTFKYHYVCPQPFYSIMIRPNGNVAPCCNVQEPIICGNIIKDTGDLIWNSGIFNQFRISMLQKKKNAICTPCRQYQGTMFKEDELDTRRTEILEKYLSTQ